MSRYIDADKMLAYISRLLGVLPLALLNEYEKNGINIVRCKECKYFRSHEESPDTCGAYNGMVSPKADDFCSRGEREGE